MKIFLKFLIILIIFSTSCEKEKEVEPKYGSLRGKIVNEFDQIIVDASVELDSKTVATYSNGIYIFNNVLPGNYKVTASKDAFITKSKDIDIIENEISILDFTLISGESFLDISDSIFTITSLNKSFMLKYSQMQVG